MTQEDKKLLLKDLCARLPYGVKIELTWWVMGEGTYINTTLELDHIEQLLNDECGDTEVKPYLRKMSSMTKEERHTFLTLMAHALPSTTVEWLDKNHFDHRTNEDGDHLIDIGLALKAPDDMYKKDEQQ